MGIRVTIESDTETLDLDEISVKGEGVEAVAGLTGFGLPPVEVFWSEGAGDGAQSRGSRVLPRDIDIPLHIKAPNRAALKTMIAKVSRIMAGRMVLRVYETGPQAPAYHLWAEVYRTGGGTFTYGDDSDGEYSWSGIVTVKAGNPFFSHSLPMDTHVMQSPTMDEHTEVATVNVVGDVAVYPTWKVYGPAKSVLIQRGNDRIEWQGQLAAGQVLSIDTESGTVMDATGLNRYNELVGSPAFFQLRPGPNEVTITTVGLYANMPERVVNYARNPYFAANTIGYEFDGWLITKNAPGKWGGWPDHTYVYPYGSTDPGGLGPAARWLTIGGGLSVGLYAEPIKGALDGWQPVYTGTYRTVFADVDSILPLDPEVGVGTQYLIRFYMLGSWKNMSGMSAQRHPRMTAYALVQHPNNPALLVRGTNLGWHYGDPWQNASPFVLRFTRTADIKGIELECETGYAIANNELAVIPATVTGMYIGPDGYYFHGETPDNILQDHKWVNNTPNWASYLEYTTFPAARVGVTYSPKEWMVV